MARTTLYSLLLLALLTLAGCAGNNDDGSDENAMGPTIETEPSPTTTQTMVALTPTAIPTITPQPTETAEATTAPVEPTATPTHVPTVTPTTTPSVETPVPEATQEPSMLDADMIDRFRKAQEQVDFALSVPTSPGGLTLSGGPLEISGPPNALGVTATFSSQPNGAFRIISLMQRAEGVGLEPERPNVETETRDDGTTIYRMAWWMDDIHFNLGATNVDRDTVLAFARSLMPLSMIQEQS